jgi:serine/threonine protein kinase
MGDVFLAEDTNLDRKVTLKVLPQGSKINDIALKRLLREAESAAGLDQPNICSKHDEGEVEGQSFSLENGIEP